MYFRELAFRVEEEDVIEFMSNLMMKIHEQHTRLALSVTFPQWKKGKPASQENPKPTAQVGSVMRVFSQSREVMDAVVAVLELKPLIDSKVLVVSDTAEAAPTEHTEAFYRVRHFDKLSRALSPYRERLIAQIEEQCADWAELPFYSVSTRKQFSLIIGRKQSNTLVLQPEMTSFGLSKSSALAYLPCFS